VRYVLFVCNHNAGRSQMAQAFFERLAPPDLRAESAGTDPAPTIWPKVVQAMRESGLEIGSRRPQKLTVEMQLHADWAVTLNCGAACPYVPTMVENWDVEDPASKSLEEVRAIRDDVESRVRDLIETRVDQIRADRTGHQLRLERLLPALAREFAGVRTDEEIRECADAILAQYDDAPLRSHVLALAHRRTRECLTRETCDAVEVG
jgi:arsenate reductase (thioredoxin)